MDLDSVRRVALSLPETSEEPHFDMASFRIRGRIFATVPPGGDVIHVFVDESETKASVSSDPAAFEELWWGKRLAGLRVRIGAAKPDEVAELLEAAWRRKAPKRVVAAYDASRPA